MVARIMHRAAQSTEVRADDNEDTIKTRIATFSKNTDEILVLYPTQTRRVRMQSLSIFQYFLYIFVLSQIDAERSVETIFADVEKSIDEMLTKKAASS